MTHVRPYTNPEIRRIAEQWKAGTPVVMIACDADRTITAIRSLSSRNRELFPKRKGGAPRRINYSTVLSMRSQGFTLQAIADRFGVTNVAIHHALNGRTSKKSRRAEGASA